MINRCLSLNKILKSGRSAFLLGPRGVGKTVLAQGFLNPLKNTFAINLLHLDILRRYIAESDLFRRDIEKKLSSNKSRLTILVDEIQKLPSLLNEVHYLIEKYKQRICFLLTGSSARKLKRGGANLLAGRAWTLKLHPFSSFEIEIDLPTILKWGTLPLVYPYSEEPQKTLQAYVNTYLKEEIMQESLVRKIEGFSRFLDVAGQMNGEPINFTSIARTAGVSTKTIQEYFSILEDTLLVFRINGWSYSVRKQLQQAPKYYFFDCGVLNAIRGELKNELKPSGFYYGKLFETFVIQEIFRLNDYFDAGFRFFYWRTNTGMEVDLILSRGPSDSPLAIEIKSSTRPQPSDLKSLLSFKSENKRAQLLCLCRTPHSYKLNSITIYPWQEGLKEIFKNRPLS